MITQNRLHGLFTYTDGHLIWTSPTSNRTKAGDKAGASDDAGYVHVGVDGRDYLLHRLIYLYHYGELPKYVDHIDRDPSNNKIENLRPLTHSQNIANCTNGNSNTGVRGVSVCKKTGRFYAQVMQNYKNHNLGFFDTLEEAKGAYQSKREELFPGVVQ
jgi:hypothetical protein